MSHKVKWAGKRQFTASTPDGRIGIYDVPKSHGGDGTAPTPMEAVLHSLAACTMVDVISILEKMRLPIESLEVEIDSERAPDHPKVYTKIHLKFIVTGDLPEKKVQRAIELSANKYCSIGAMLNSTTEITHELVLN
jgi:putative redox protein